MSHVDQATHIREELHTLIEYVDAILSPNTESDVGDKPEAKREFALVKTKLQEARMWAGMVKSHYDTGFVPSDVPVQDEETSQEEDEPHDTPPEDGTDGSNQSGE